MRYSVKALLLLFVLFAFQMHSQTQSKKIYSYTFEGTLLLENVTLFEQRISQLNYVSSAKVKYKPDSHKGEIFIEVNEPAKASEGDKTFDIIELKKLIQSYNLNPGELILKN
jgi:hypothetical protein